MLDIIRDRAQSWGVKLIFGIIILVFIFWGIGSFNFQSPDIIVTVNGNNITRKEFAFEYENYVAASKMQMPNIPDKFFQSEEQLQRVLGLMIEKELLLQAATSMGMSVGVSEVQNSIMEMPGFKDGSGKFNLTIYDGALKRRGIKKNEFEEEIRKLLLISKLQRVVMSAANLSEEEAFANFRSLQETREVDYIFFPSSDFVKQAEISDAQAAEYYELNKSMFTVPRHIDVEYLSIAPQSLATRYEIDDAQVREFYEANKERFVEPLQVRARHIVFAIPSGASEEELAEIGEKAEAVYKSAVGGADFAALAQDNSNDPSAANGGELGWLKLNDLIPAFSDQLKDLKPGDVSKPFVFNSGYHIIKAEERKEESQLPFAEVRDQIKLRIASEKGAEEMPDILDKAVGDILNGKEIEAIAHELGLTTITAKNLKREDVARELAIAPDAVESLFLTPAGIMLDRPIVSGSGYILAKVTRVQEEHVAPIEEVRDRIVSLLKEEEAKAIASRKADEALAALKAGENLPAGLEFKSSEFFNRQTGPDELGPAQEFVTSVFKQQNREEWIGPYSTSRGIVLARLKAVDHPSEADWEKVKEMIMMQMAVIKEEGLLQAYLGDLQARAEISNYNLESLKFDK